jgi:hypothetical protein
MRDFSNACIEAAKLAKRVHRTRALPKTARLSLAGSLAILAVGISLVPMADGRKPFVSAAPPAPAANVLTADASDQPQGVLSGRITDETGAPVTDADVQLRLSNVESPSAKTDQDGRYHINKVAKQGEYEVYITSKRWVGMTNYRELPRVNLSNQTQLVRNYTLKRACQLRIQVVNEEGLPVEDATVYTNLLSNEPYRGMEYKNTDKTGWVTLSSLQPSDGTRIVGVSSKSYGLAHLQLVLNEPESSTHQIKVEKGEPVVGKAICKDGKPAVGWRVDALPTWWHFGAYPTGATIGKDGSFTLPHVVPDKYKITISIPTSQSGSMVKPVKNEVALPPAEGLLALSIDYPSPGNDVAISGRIRFEGQKLNRGFHASAHGADGVFSSYDCYIEPGQKEFKFDRLPPGLYRVAFESTEFESVVLPSVTAPANNLDVTIKVRGMLHLSGTVVRADNQKPLREFRVLVTKLRSLSGPNYLQEKTWHEFQDAEGKFAVDVVGPGIYVAAVEAKGLGTRQSDPVKIDGSSSPPVRIELGGGQRLSGMVVDEQGRPVDGAVVVPILGPRRALKVTLARASEVGAEESVRGKFTLPPLAAGQESLKVTHSDYAPKLVGIETVEKGSEAKPLKIVLEEGGTLRGNVYGERGQPQAGVTLHLQDGGAFGSGDDEQANRLATVVTDANGFYEARHLPAVLLQVTRSDKWEAQGVMEQMILTENGKTQSLDFGGPTRMTGRLVVNGKPLAAANIVLSSGGPYFSAFRANGHTDDDGVFALFGIPPGEKTLYYSENDRAASMRAAKFKVSRGMAPLGTIERTTGKLTVRCQPAAALEVGNVNLSLAEFDPIWISRNPAGQLLSRQGPQDPFVFDHVPVGKCVLAAHRPDHLTAHKIVDITADNLNPAVDMKLPEGTASLSGKFEKSPTAPVTYRNLKLWSADESMVGVIFPNEDGLYRLENLPAGQYLLKEKDTRDAETLLKISFTEGEAKTLDITPDMLDKSSPLGFTSIRTYTTAGLPLAGCEVRFDNPADAPRLNGSQDGRMGFVGKPGTYKATIEYPGFKPLPATVELKNVGSGGRLPDNFEVSYRLEATE